MPTPTLRAAMLALFTTATAIAQNGPPPDVEWLVGEAREVLLQKPAPWVQLLDRSTLSVGRYRLKAGGKDSQQPHDRDEVYFVVSGKGRFTAAEKTRDVAAGDVVFVAARARHHFHDITEDLDLFVMFSTAVPVTGGMRAGPKPTAQTPYPETSPRGSTRIFYWFRDGSAGQAAIDHGRPRWDDRYARFLEQPSDNRWRLGENFWTVLDTNIELELGSVKVPVGAYYCVLQHREQHGLELVLLDPQKMRAPRLDAYEARKTEGGIAVPLRHVRGETTFASRLEIELTVDRSKQDHGALEIRFGPHALRADVVLHPDES